MSDEPLDPKADPFRPPDVPTEVHCLHCDQEYESYLIEWRVETAADGRQQGFWCCPTPGCGGMGFGFDILPTDPSYRDECGGWCSFDEEEDEEDGEDDFDDSEFDDEDFGPDDWSDDAAPPDPPPPGNGHKRTNGDQGGDDVPW